MPGAIAPMGLFDPLGFSKNADELTLKRYREAELTHGRVAMLATVGFLAGEAAAGKSFLWDASVTGPAISHIPQIPPAFWAVLTICIGRAEFYRAETAFVEPENLRYDRQYQLRPEYTPGDLGFDPLGLMPDDPDEFAIMQTKELQNGRLAMLAAAGFFAQEAVNHQGILENLSNLPKYQG